MKFISKQTASYLLFVPLIAFYFFLRLFHLLSLPMFTDEAIYTRWAQIARQDAAWRFISLTDGKQPMFIWADMTLMKFVHDPLLAGRLVSVGTGMLTVIGLFFLGRELFKNKWVGIVTAALYVLYPFALVYDRMALYDSMVALFAVWSLYLEIILVRNPRAWVAFTLALVMGGGMLTKTSNFFSLYLLPVTILLFDFRKEKRIKRLFQWVGFAAIAVGLANLYYSMLRLSPFFHIITDKNAIFVYPLNEWLEHPWTFFIGNLHGLWSWFSTYTTWPVIALMVGALLVQRKFTREKIVLLTFFSVPFVLLALFGKVLYPRFIFFMAVSLLPLVALFLVDFLQKKQLRIVGILAILMIIFIWGRADSAILTDFARAPIADSDLNQYSNDWPAGGGIPEIISFLGNKAKTQDIFILSDGTFGSLPTYAVEIYLGNNPHIDKRGIYPIPEEFPEDLLQKAKVMPVYVILNQLQKPSERWPLQKIVTYQKGVGISHVTLYIVHN
jgi:4-amino-4-deoxy-L-arabinose transferase-like glycosyltransferase